MERLKLVESSSLAAASVHCELSTAKSGYSVLVIRDREFPTVACFRFSKKTCRRTRWFQERSSAVSSGLQRATRSVNDIYVALYVNKRCTAAFSTGLCDSSQSWAVHRGLDTLKWAYSRDGGAPSCPDSYRRRVDRCRLTGGDRQDEWDCSFP